MKTKLLLVIFLVAFFSACNNSQQHNSNHSKLKHVVVCWLKEPGNQDHRQQLFESKDILKDIPGVLDVNVGSVLQSNRAIVDDSFDVAFVFSFQDSTAMVNYLSHPDHKNLQQELLRPLVEKILVYDFIENEQ